MSLFGIGASAVANIAGGLLGQAASAKSAQANAELQAKLQRENWEYSQKHAHTFEVEDLRNAGLNPIISATNGQIASMPNISISDNGTGSNITNALTSLGKNILDEQLKGAELDNDAKRIAIERDKYDLEKDMAEYRKKLLSSQTSYYDTQVDYLSGKNAREVAFNEAQVRQINSDIENAKVITAAQAENLRAGATLSYAEANRASADIARILAEKENIEINTKEMNQILTDPRRVNERKQLEAGLRGENVMGILMNLGLVAKEFNGLMPSRVSFGFPIRR